MGLDAIDPLDKMLSDYQLVSDSYSGSCPANPYPMLAERRGKCPVMHGDVLAEYSVPSQADFMRSGRPIVTLFRYKDVHAVLKDPVNWQSYLLAEGFGAAVDNMLFTGMDGEVHDTYRALIQKPFSRPEIRRRMDELVVPIIRDEYIARMRPLGRTDLIRDFALPFPLRIAYAFLGFPDDPRVVQELAGLALKVLAGPQFDPELARTTVPASMAAGVRMHEIILPIVAARRAEGTDQDDVIGFMMRSEIGGRRFSDDDITAFVRMLLLAAGETTSRTFGNMMVQLLERPDVLEEVRQNRSLIPKAINETMRRDPTAAALARIAAKDMEIGDVKIAKGTAVSLSIASANHDPEVYERPDELWIQRPMRPLLSFGFGPHICMGMHLALAEIEVALDALLDLPNLRFDPDHEAPFVRGLNLRGADSIHVVWDTD
ncbi:cytochrome P450 [Sphingobium fontiphilum]|uniref:Cytochrome P450 n=1 Tax=Sphingobium fontiphilum TaxID=944425 RepID=A0A7W6DLZ9_9SPHN|nr:cytochrome P450 [Sphingobium fontiphilum]MBB3983085.1 cytochrome P450 [Sphingobium fontiphilum]